MTTDNELRALALEWQSQGAHSASFKLADIIAVCDRIAALEAALRDALTKIDVYVPEVVRYKGIGHEVRALYDVLDATATAPTPTRAK